MKKIQPKIFIDTEVSLESGYTLETGYAIGQTIHFNDTGNEYYHSTDGVWKPVGGSVIQADLALKENTANKQNSLATDGTGVKFPTVDAVNGGLALAKDSVIYDSTFNAAFLTGTWTADATTETLTSTVAHGLIVGDAVSFDSGTGVLPTGIVAEPEYYFVESVPTTTSLKLKSLWNGAILDITSNGTTGWKIRKASINLNTALDFSNYTEIDIISHNASLIQSPSGNAYWSVFLSPSSARIILNNANVYGGSNLALLYSSIMTKKYINTPLKIKIRKIATYIYWIEIYINGLSSDNTYMSSSTVHTITFTGIITNADITMFDIGSGYTREIRNGTRLQIIKRA